MRVRVFDENHEEDLEETINNFLEDERINVIDIKYQVAIMQINLEQIYCYSALIMYDIKKKEENN